jgi:hypothetical protein
VNNKLLVGFFVALAAVLVLPIAVTTLKKPAGAPVAAPTHAVSAPAVAAPTPAPVVPQPSQAPPDQPQGPQPSATELLTNTVWQVQTPRGVIQVQLNPGGKAVASHPMVGNLDATWRVNGDNLVIQASVMGQSQTISCQIVGNQIIYQNAPIRRLR